MRHAANDSIDETIAQLFQRRQNLGYFFTAHRCINHLPSPKIVAADRGIGTDPPRLIDASPRRWRADLSPGGTG
jgi:hypothetical protein